MINDHDVADAARAALDRLSDQLDAALAEVERVEGMLATERKTGDWLAGQLDQAREHLNRTRRFMDAAWPAEDNYGRTPRAANGMEINVPRTPPLPDMSPEAQLRAGIAWALAEYGRLPRSVQ